MNLEPYFSRAYSLNRADLQGAEQHVKYKIKGAVMSGMNDRSHILIMRIK